MMKIILTLLAAIIYHAHAYCQGVGANPGFSSAPQVEQVTSTSVKVSWEGMVTLAECADQFVVKSWSKNNPNDYTLSDLLPINQFSYIVVNIIPSEEYVFQAVAREDKGILGKDWNKSPPAYFRTTGYKPPEQPKTKVHIELLVENIVFSGHMIHWSVEQEYLAISDIWGKKYLRFAEKLPEATIIAQTDTTNTNAGDLPYEIKTLRVPKDVVFFIRPQETTEGSHPIMVPVQDLYKNTEDTDEVILAFNDRFSLVSWDLETLDMNVTTAQWFSAHSARIELSNFMIPSPAWIDPSGQLFTGTHDIRPFEKVITPSVFSFFPNTFEPKETFWELSLISCQPTGMAWSTDNSTLYFADGDTKNISKCVYDSKKTAVSNCHTMLNVAEEISATAVPRGMATDVNSHVWVALADEEKSAIIEIDPETSMVISTFGFKDPLIDIAFAGEDLDFLYVLSKKHLYKITGLGVKGMHVPDFIWKH